MAQGYHEQGIRDGEDYGTQFLNARKDGGAGGDEPPKDVPSPPPPPPGGRSVGQILMIVLIVGAVLGGGVAVFLLAGGGGSAGDDLISAGDDVEIGDHDRRGTTSTTGEATTTTEARETTTTTAARTTTTASTTPTTPPSTPTTPVPTTAAIACPGGFAGSQLEISIAALPAGQYRVTITGSTKNETTAAINLQLVVPVVGSEGTTNAKPDKYGSVVAPGASLSWVATTVITSDSEPEVTRASGTWTWTDPKFRACPTGTFG